MRAVIAGVVASFLSGLGLPGAVIGDDGEVLGYLVMRDYRVAIESTGEGVRYSVRDVSGALLATRLTPGELSARYPRVHATISSGVARSDIPGALVWAGL